MKIKIKKTLELTMAQLNKFLKTSGTITELTVRQDTDMRGERFGPPLSLTITWQTEEEVGEA